VKGTAPPIGAQLRERRSENGISLRELARRLHVSASLVSQIETGKAQPSVRTLYAIVNELGLSLDEVLELAGREAAPERPSESPAAHIARRGEGTAHELAEGIRHDRLASWHDPSVEFVVTVYAPGAGYCAGTRREFGLVLSGTLQVAIGDDVHELHGGDSISVDSDEPHRVTNAGPDEARAVWATAPRGSAGERLDTGEHALDAHAGRPPDAGGYAGDRTA
jgi:transcriptional regulator with XRE-family HTH domain